MQEPDEKMVSSFVGSMLFIGFIMAVMFNVMQVGITISYDLNKASRHFRFLFYSFNAGFLVLHPVLLYECIKHPGVVVFIGAAVLIYMDAVRVWTYVIYRKAVVRLGNGVTGYDAKSPLTKQLEHDISHHD